MRKLFYAGAFLTVTAALAVYLATAYASRHPDSFVATGTALACKIGTQYNPAFRIGQALTSGGCRSCESQDCPDNEEETFSIPEEPQPVTDSLPPDGTPVAPEETIDVIQQQRIASEKIEAASIVDSDSASQLASEGSAPVVSETLDGNDDCWRTMPTCPEDEEGLPAIMPYATVREEVDLDRSNVKKGTNVRRKRATGEQLIPEQEGRHPRSNVDTSEFRPSDAKKGEFDRIPF
jgi:hypothetical protein